MMVCVAIVQIYGPLELRTDVVQWEWYSFAIRGGGGGVKIRNLIYLRIKSRNGEYV